MVKKQFKKNYSSIIVKSLLILVTILILIGDLIINIIRFAIDLLIHFFYAILGKLNNTIRLITGHTLSFFRRFRKFKLRPTLPGRFIRTLSGFTNLLKVKISHLRLSSHGRLSRVSQKKVKIDKKVVATKLYLKFRIRDKLKYYLIGIVCGILLMLFYQGYIFVQNIPNPKLITNVNFPVSSKIFDRNGKLLYEIYREQNRTPVQITQLPSDILNATIAIEDAGFYNHQGISFTGGILRAIKDMVKTGNLQGGSTITQQLVKTSLLTPQRTWERKIKEAFLAVWAEKIYTKPQILEMYLNQVPYGGSSYGIEEAAQTYFGKSAKDLSLAESAFLSGLPQAPSYYSPYVNPRRSLFRRNEVLAAMLKHKYINKKQYSDAIKQPLNIIPLKTIINAPHFVFYVKSLLEEKYGIKKVEEGGLRVYTSLDLDLQLKAEEILNQELKKVANLKISNAALLITMPKTGEILAMVGSKDYFDQPYGAYNVTIADRQPGSSIKPLLYSLALESTFNPASILVDAPVKYQIKGAPDYMPVNYDGRYHGLVPLRYALANSYNIPAVKVLNSLGVDNFIRQAQELGISSWTTPKRYGLSLALGGAEVKMIDMAVAYGVFANNGVKTGLNPFIRIEDYQNNDLYSDNNDIKPKSTEVLTPQTAFLINDILSDNFARRMAFGSQSALDIINYKVAVKTGTTNLKKDNWTIGYTPKFLVSVWVGNNDNTPMDPSLTSGITGAAPLWHNVMDYLLNQYSQQINYDDGYSNDFIKPTGIIDRKCYFGRQEFFLAGTDKIECSDAALRPTPTVTPVQQTTN